MQENHREIDNTDKFTDNLYNIDNTIAASFVHTSTQMTINGKMIGYSCKLNRIDNKKSNLSFFIDESKELGPSDLVEKDYHGTVYCNDEKIITIKSPEIYQEKTILFKMPRTINYISEWILPENLRDKLKEIYLVCNDMIIITVPGILIKGNPSGNIVIPISEMLIACYCIIDIRLKYSKKSSVINGNINSLEFIIKGGNAYGWSHSRGYLSHMDFPVIKFNVNDNQNIFCKEIDRLAYTIIFKKFTAIFEDSQGNLQPVNSIIKSIEISHSSEMFGHDKIILWKAEILQKCKFSPKFKNPIFAHKLAHPKITIELYDNHPKGSLYIIFHLRHITRFLVGTTMRLTL